MTNGGESESKSVATSDKTITFPLGIPGFEKYTTYVVYHKKENDFAAFWLESCDDSEITFTLVDPGQYGLSYEIELTDEELEVLKVTSPDKLGVFMILNKKSVPGQPAPVVTANIAGPIIINFEEQLGIQKVIVRSKTNTLVYDEPK